MIKSQRGILSIDAIVAGILLGTLILSMSSLMYSDGVLSLSNRDLYEAEQVIASHLDIVSGKSAAEWESLGGTTEELYGSPKIECTYQFIEETGYDTHRLTLEYAVSLHGGKKILTFNIEKAGG